MVLNDLGKRQSELTTNRERTMDITLEQGMFAAIERAEFLIRVMTDAVLAIETGNSGDARYLLTDACGYHSGHPILAVRREPDRPGTRSDPS
jgi:hypothetical protein